MIEKEICRANTKDWPCGISGNTDYSHALYLEKETMQLIMKIQCFQHKRKSNLKFIFNYFWWFKPSQVLRQPYFRLIAHYPRIPCGSLTLLCHFYFSTTPGPHCSEEIWAKNTHLLKKILSNSEFKKSFSAMNLCRLFSSFFTGVTTLNARCPAILP